MELGESGSGQINIVTKAGTTCLHGTAYEFLLETSADAHSFNESPAGNSQQNNFGGALGGRPERSYSSSLRGAAPFQPTRWWGRCRRKKRHPRYRPAGKDFNPFSSHVGANGGTVRDPFPGNKIPQNLLYPWRRRYRHHARGPTRWTRARCLWMAPGGGGRGERFEQSVDRAMNTTSPLYPPVDREHRGTTPHADSGTP